VMPRNYDLTGRYEDPDMVIVDYLLREVTPPSPPGFAERLAVVRKLAGHMSDRQIGERIGRDQRTVLRWRRRWQIPGLRKGQFNGATRPVDPILPGKARQGM
jgi:hypothetical protein